VKLFVAELVSIALFKSEFDSRFNVVWFGDYGIMNEHFIRPPVRSNGRSYKMLVMFIFIFIFFSPTVLRVPSTERPETLPPDRNLRVFYNASPKIRGALPPKKFGAKNMQNFGRFWTTSEFDREYLRNG